MVKPAAIAAVFAVAFPIFITGCAEEGMVETVQSVVDEHSAFQQAQTDQSSREWSSFLEKYPNSSQVDEAKQGLRVAYWKETRASGTPTAYMDFAQNHPDSSHVGEARDEARRLLLAHKGSLDECSRYLATFPKDPSASALRRVLEQMRFASLKNSSDPNAVTLFIAQYPGTKNARSLMGKKEADKFHLAQSVGTRLAYHWFLKRFPSATQAARATRKLSAHPPVYYPANQNVNINKIVAQMRQNLPDFRLGECWEALSKKLEKQPDIFSARSEDLRSHLAALLTAPEPAPAAADNGGDNSDLDDISMSKSGDFSSCPNGTPVLDHSQKETVLNAIGALNRIAQERSKLSSLIGDPQTVLNAAQTLSQTASSFADDAEGKEEEEDALYGQGSENPDNPKETASALARDAARRAKYSLKIAQTMANHSDASGLMDKMDTQAKLLMLVIAEAEKF